ncbi:MAG: DivIVA domain-containing protein [Coriobacteriales bacterium]
MAITMQDIQDEGFEHALRGYDVGQVDVFLERVANEVDAMNKQIADLESQLKEAKDELTKTREELAEASAASLTSPAELEQAGLVERELRSELEIAQGRLAAMTVRAEEAEAKLEPMQEQLGEKNKLDNAIAEAFISAQRSAAQIKEDARIEGDRIYHESEAKAREFIRESLAKKAAIDNEIKALSDYAQKFREQYLDMLERFAAHAKEEFNNLTQGVTEDQVEAELPKLKPRATHASDGMPTLDEDDLPRLTTQQIPQINIPSIMPEDGK